MPPSSLIFAVIVAVWAAYVIQHWVHRREHVATARSVDRFSEAMRVLERRQHRPQVDLSEPTPRSYSVSLVRPAAPDVMIKRAHPSAPTSPVPEAPLVAEMTASTAPSRDNAPRNALKPRVSSTRVRGIALLTAATIFVVSVLAAATGLLTWWAVPVAAGVGVFAVAMIRRSVGQASARPAVAVRSIRPPKVARLPTARRSRRSAASAGGSAAAAFAANMHDEQLTSSPLAQTFQPAPTLPSAPVASPAAAMVDSPSDSVASRSVSTSSGVFNIEAVEQVAAAVSAGDANAAPVVAQPLEPGTWAPVPVPPPTYTLKAKAQPRPVRVELPTELPQDGIALSLEEEFEELPSAIRGLA